jgi:hypothetical protein
MDAVVYLQNAWNLKRYDEAVEMVMNVWAERSELSSLDLKQLKAVAAEA